MGPLRARARLIPLGRTTSTVKPRDTPSSLTWNSKLISLKSSQLGIPSEPGGRRPLGLGASIGVAMRNERSAVPDQREAGPVSPVITGGHWLGDDDPDQSLTLQLRLPVSAEELAAALYSDEYLGPADLTKDENVWGFAAVAIVQDGLKAIQHHRDEVLVAEARGTLGNPAWLATCRRRVAEVSGTLLPSPTADGTVSGLARVRALTEIAS